jgi:hypothetical protein
LPEGRSPSVGEYWEFMPVIWIHSRERKQLKGQIAVLLLTVKLEIGTRKEMKMVEISIKLYLRKQQGIQIAVMN